VTEIEFHCETQSVVHYIRAGWRSVGGEQQNGMGRAYRANHEGFRDCRHWRGGLLACPLRASVALAVIEVQHQQQNIVMPIL
jgi:hypothetical protein